MLSWGGTNAADAKARTLDEPIIAASPIVFQL
jgi:hypothetical protein